MPDPRADRLEDIDWDAIWDREWRLGARGSGVEYWNQRVADIDNVSGKDEYYRELLRRVTVSPGDSVLDVGCGTGALAIPLARKVRLVTALDWSPTMLEALGRRVAEAGVDNVKPVLADWLQVELGREVELHDVVIASRSLPMDNVREALVRLDRAATRRCYLTWIAEGNEFEAGLAAILGRPYHPFPPYTIIYNMLHGMGILADIGIFQIRGSQRFDSLREAMTNSTRGKSVDGDTAERLEAFLRSRLHRDGAGYRRDFTVRWALISWSKADG